MAIFYHHHQRRATVYLYAEPAGIAAIAALLSRSDFIDRLDPTDNEERIRRKLKDLRFKLDPVRGIISSPGDPKGKEDGDAES